MISLPREDHSPLPRNSPASSHLKSVFESPQALNTSSRPFRIANTYTLFLSIFPNSLLGHSGIVRYILPVGATFVSACLCQPLLNHSIRSWDHDFRRRVSSRPQVTSQRLLVDYTTRSTWGNILPHSSDTLSSESASQPTSTSNNATRAPESFSTSREVSSIPRSDKENWVYPSEAQFAAMARKNHDPRAPDMKVVVPIHNATNERAWLHIKEWEAGRGEERCGGIRLVGFKGRPGEPRSKARILTLLGYVPFHSLSSVAGLAYAT